MSPALDASERINQTRQSDEPDRGRIDVITVIENAFAEFENRQVN